ncbi:UDP-glucose/GDP-mannose dehydrogenase family protein [Marinobacter nauticus]|jgi:GDP-mannose 6-dehydrogenase|uniref:nucleotide sugar dehydrogenase n=1 Tax=Marinobacter nauticus TaxID=2743 RepID=UPI001A8E3940|nr:UDP-glucose/GDP-mannose dehydrogenase family protein [Marinobacter nauticus]MBN8240677.1 UDP-glucose/GDP-mannose dehydrogenase family protein [Marinobacter nauticus]MCC4271409.1 UDP-glucose/GDP-mannose dehydrogenase family protein [Marinobacter nauticus]
MRVSIFGLGYVGAVCTASLASRGHEVTGVDVSPVKIDLINNGRSPIVEPGLEELLGEGVRSRRIRAATDGFEAVQNSELSMICVGTPSKANGDLDLTFVEKVSRDIGVALKSKPDWHLVVVRSTVLPGTVRDLVIPILEENSGKRAGTDFGVCVNPEFLRESTAIKDYDHPPMTVIGELDERSGDLLAELYNDLEAPLVRKPIEVAEMIKYTCNVWHATKVSFANEIGSIAKSMGVDGRDVMDVMCLDKKLNISRYYMRPGFAFGGSCLPKDVRALTYRANQLDVCHPLLSSIISSNNEQVAKAFKIVTGYGRRKISMLGLSFKANTDDLRESPLVELAEMLIGKGYDLKIFDRNVDYARTFGANRDYINQKIPHLSNLMDSDLRGVVEHGDVVVVGNNDELFETVIADVPEGKRVVDLVGFMECTTNDVLEGICW